MYENLVYEGKKSFVCYMYVCIKTGVYSVKNSMSTNKGLFILYEESNELDR